MKKIFKRVAAAVTALSVLAAAVVFDVPERIMAIAAATAAETAEETHGNHSDWESFTADTTFENEKKYYLNGDVALNSQITIASGVNVTLCLNGHTITAKTTEESKFRIFYINGGSLTLCDCQGGGKLTGGNVIDGNTSINGSNSGGAIKIYGSNSTFIMNGGTISDCKAWAGSAVYVDSGSKFTMNGGTISGNTASCTGGGVFLGYNSEFTMNGGTISNNTASSDSGGGIGTNYESCKITMNGGTISNNQAGKNGGGVDNVGTFNMTGGMISGNTATQSGGGVYNKVTFTMTGGTISGNKATQSGGGVYNKGTFTMSGGTISGNEASSTTYYSGGGVYVGTSATFEMTGGTIGGTSEADKNTAGIGGGVYVDGSNAKFTMSGDSKILGNESKSGSGGAGGVCVHGSAKFTMNGGTISGNKATNSGGGGVLVGSSCEFKMTDGEISGNTADGRGGGVFVHSSATFEMTGGTISDNEAKDTSTGGGGVFVYKRDSSTFTMTDGKIENNKAVNGGGVFVDGENTSNGKGIFTMSGGTISGNTARINGGGVYNSGTFTMTGGMISNNKANDTNLGGGGVLVGGSGEFIMSGNSMISGNTAANGGGGVYVSDSNAKFTMNGGTISDNKVKRNGGGVRFNNGTFTINGKVDISGNTKTGDSSEYNVTLGKVINKDLTITIGNDFDPTSKIGVNVDPTPTCSKFVDVTGTASGISAGFTADIDGQSIVYNDDKVQLQGAHTWGAWAITKDPTTETTGTAKRTCEISGEHTETIELPVLTDTEVWENATTEPTCTEDGSDVYKSEYGTVTIPIDATGHDTEHTEAKDATCTEDGNIEYWYCSKCDTYFSDEECTTEITEDKTVISAEGHKLTEVEGYPAAEDEDGLKAHWHCEVCEKNFTDSEGKEELDNVVIPALGHEHSYSEDWESDDDEHWHKCSCGEKSDIDAHTWGEWTEIKPATEDNEGSKKRECTVCHYIAAETIPTLSHTLTKHEKVEADCETAGTEEYWSCSGCGKNFSDENGKTEVKDITIPAKGHTPSEDWESDDDEHWHECSCGEKSDIDAHTWGEWTETKPATEDNEGSKKRECTVCHYIAAETIPALSHTLTKHERVEADCENAGTEEYWSCSGCGKNFSDENGKTEVKDITIPAEGHTPVTDARVEPTYTTPGKTEGSHCSVCQKVLTAQEELPALGYKGDCGDNVTWEYDEDNKTLTITGDGDMDNWTDENPAPWSEIADEIEKVVIDDGVTSIGDNAFEGCDKLTDVTIPDSVETIGDNAFKGTSLTEVDIPGSVTEIGDGAFADCDDLDKVTFEGTTPPALGDGAIGNDVSIVVPEGSEDDYKGADGFDDLTDNITDGTPDPEKPVTSGDCGDNVTWEYGEGDKTLTITGDGDMDDYNDSSETPWSEIADEIEKVVIDDGVTSIGDNAFEGCDKLTDVTIPDSVTSIGDNAFSGTGLTEVTIPDSVTEIGDGAFADCDDLDKVTFEGTTPPALGDGAIGNDVSIVVPEGSEDDYKGADGFDDLTDNITDGTGDNGEIGGDCGDNLTWTFDGDDNTLTITGDGDMDNWTDENPAPWSEIADDIEKVVIDDGVTSIGDNAFEGCDKLTDVTIPDSVETIGDNAFKGTGLTEVTIPDSVTEIGDGAFADCDDLDKVTFEGTTPPALGDGAIGSDVSIVVPEGSEDDYKGADGFDDLTDNITDGTGDNGEIGGDCGDNLTWTFDGDDNTLTITGDGDMDNWTDENPAPWSEIADDIEKVVIDDGVTSIGDNAFEGCDKLTDVTIPDSVTSIGDNAFSGTGLTEVTIPDSVTEIGDGAFADCGDLDKVTFEGTTPPALGDGAIGNDVSIVVPEGSEDDYKGADGFDDLTDNITTTTPVTPVDPVDPVDPVTPVTPNTPDNSNSGSNPENTHEVQQGENVPKTEIATPTDELTNAVLTPEELAQIKDSDEVKVVLQIDDTVPAEDKQKVESVLEANDDLRFAQYMNITLFKVINGSKTQVTKTNEPIRITFEIPEALRRPNRTFAVIRVHDGETTVLSDLDNDENTVTIETDKFSTYALVYRENASAPGNSGNPSTGIAISLVPLAAAVTVLMVTVKRKKK